MEKSIMNNPGLATTAGLAALFATLATLGSLHVGEARSYIATDVQKHDESALSIDTTWRNDNENARNIGLGLLITDLVVYYTVQLATAGKKRENEPKDSTTQVF